ncbi:MAG: hypothetical protein ABIH39_00665 [Candidatus Margulisiibacteriota bacterium]
MQTQGLNQAGMWDNMKFEAGRGIDNIKGNDRNIDLNKDMMPKVKVDTGSKEGKNISFNSLQEVFNQHKTMHKDAVQDFNANLGTSSTYKAIKEAIKSDVTVFFNNNTPIDKQVKAETIDKMAQDILSEFDAKVKGKDVDMEMSFKLSDSDYKPMKTSAGTASPSSEKKELSGPRPQVYYDTWRWQTILRDAGVIDHVDYVEKDEDEKKTP